MTTEEMDAVKERLTELTEWFFRIIDGIDDTAINGATSLLVGVLKEYDNLLGGSDFNTDSPSDLASATAVDVRAIYAMFKGFKNQSSAERRKAIKSLESANFFPGQLGMLENAAAKQIYNDSRALLPLFRKRYVLSARPDLAIVAYGDLTLRSQPRTKKPKIPNSSKTTRDD